MSWLVNARKRRRCRLKLGNSKRSARKSESCWWPLKLSRAPVEAEPIFPFCGRKCALQVHSIRKTRSAFSLKNSSPKPRLLQESTHQRCETEFRGRFPGEFAHQRAHALAAAAALGEDERDATVLRTRAAVPGIVRDGCEIETL